MQCFRFLTQLSRREKAEGVNFETFLRGTMLSKSLIIYRSLLKSAKGIDDYNFRSYFVRKVKQGYRKQAGLTGPAADEALAAAETQLAQLIR